MANILLCAVDFCEQKGHDFQRLLNDRAYKVPDGSGDDLGGENDDHSENGEDGDYDHDSYDSDDDDCDGDLQDSLREELSSFSKRTMRENHDYWPNCWSRAFNTNTSKVMMKELSDDSCGVDGDRFAGSDSDRHQIARGNTILEKPRRKHHIRQNQYQRFGTHHHCHHASL